MLLVGCTSQSIKCPLPNEKIESMCNVKIQTVGAAADACNYLSQDYVYAYGLSNESAVTGIHSISGVKSALQNKSIDFANVNFQDGAVYYSHPYGGTGGLKPGWSWVLHYEKNGAVYIVSAISYANSSTDDPVHCMSKDKLIEIAQARIQNEGSK